MKTIFFDFEYRNNYQTNDIILCTTKVKHKTSLAWDLRDHSGRSDFIRYVEENNTDLWCAYNADADLQCLMSLGLNIDNLKMIDLMAEAAMIMRTKQRYFSQKASLLVALDKFGIQSPVSSDYKETCRDIILNNPIYTSDQWEVIVEYGLLDVDLLPDLLDSILQVHKVSRAYKSVEQYFDSALSRGEYVKSASTLFRKSKGFPVDEVLLQRIFENRETIQNTLCQKVNSSVGEIYRWDESESKYILNNKALDELLTNDPGIKVARTKTGLVSTKVEALKKMTKGHPKFNLIYTTHKTLLSLRSSDLRALNVTGYICAGYRTFNQDTGRTSPKLKEGFLLNLAPWMRSIIHPHPGEVIIGADWSQQEIYIGAVLSGDKKLMEAYSSGDIYLYLAKMAGAIPESGTKQTHPTERQNFKAIQLGIGYGKGVDALSLDIYNGNIKAGVPELTLDEASIVARKIMGWHRRTFTSYWRWIERHIEASRSRGYYVTSDGSWVRFCQSDTPKTKLMNLPFQSGGAALLRQAVKLVSKEGSLDMICSLHDAIYILSTVERQEQDRNKLIDLMNQACRDVYGEMSKFYNGTEVSVNLDTKVFTHESGYTDERGVEMFDTVMTLLDEVEKIGDNCH